MTTRICEGCGQPTSRRPYYYGDGVQHVYCHECSISIDQKREAAERIVRNKSNQIKRKLIQERGRHCENCGGSFDSLHGHHVIPLHMGGENSPENMQLLCESCHRMAHPHGTRSVAR